MHTDNAVLMRSARESLQDRWGLAIAVAVVNCVLLSVPQGIKNVGFIATMLISGPLAGGLAIFVLAIARNQEAKFEQLFEGFKTYTTYLVAYAVMTLYIVLWSLLLIVPGIIASFSYAMTFYIIADNPTISATDAIERSSKMMHGNKGKYFSLLLRFFGWAILSILTAGIGFLWLVPYIQVTTAKFYDDIKGDNVIGETPEPVASSAPSEPAPLQDQPLNDMSKAPEAFEAKLKDGPFAAASPEVTSSEVEDAEVEDSKKKNDK